MLTIDQIVEGEIESIAFGGEGILRYRGFVVFVPFTAIGDKISCRIVEVKRSFAKGAVAELKHPGSHRITPRCPYFGTCGGCQLQHLDLEAQLNYKLRAVQDALKRIGHLSIPPFAILPASENWTYRRHITLHLRPIGEGFEAGYIGQDNRSLVVVKECPIFADSSDPILSQLQQLASQISHAGKEEGRVTLLKNHREQYIFSFLFGTGFDIQQKIFKTVLQQCPEIAGILVQTPEKQIILGDPYSEQQLEGLTFRYSPQTFIQNHPEQSAAIYRQICLLASHKKQTHILDLYCGFGTASLLLARTGHSVTGIETNPQAVQFAKENAVVNHLANAHFLQGDVERALPQWLKKHRASLIVVNPPRQGLAKKVVEMLLKTQAESLIYVSCMPATLARDLQALSQKYQVKEGYVYDMFPQTAHVETLVSLERNK